MSAQEIDVEVNRVLDRVIEDRRTIRAFTPEAPPRGLVEQVLRAGLLAPYAAAAVGGEKSFRRFIVMEQGSKSKQAAAEMIRAQVMATWEAISKQAAEAGEMPGFAARLKAVAEGGELGFESAPYYIVVAELKGFPPVEHRSLAHVLENMWLKATALGMGLRLISATTQQESNPEFCALLDLPEGKFGIDGCALGYPVKVPPPTERPDIEEVTAWLE